MGQDQKFHLSEPSGGGGGGKLGFLSCYISVDNILA